MATLDDNLRKIPPQNLEAESSVLGGILLENEAINQVIEVLRAEDFYRESHRKIFRAMIDITDRNEPVAELRPIGDGRDPAAVRLARLAAAGGLTLPTRVGLARFSPVALTSGSGSAAVAADRDERG